VIWWIPHAVCHAPPSPPVHSHDTRPCGVARVARQSPSHVLMAISPRSPRRRVGQGAQTRSLNHLPPVPPLWTRVPRRSSRWSQGAPVWWLASDLPLSPPPSPLRRPPVCVHPPPQCGITGDAAGIALVLGLSSVEHNGSRNPCAHLTQLMRAHVHACSPEAQACPGLRGLQGRRPLRPGLRPGRGGAWPAGRAVCARHRPVNLRFGRWTNPTLRLASGPSKHHPPPSTPGQSKILVTFQVFSEPLGGTLARSRDMGNASWSAHRTLSHPEVQPRARFCAPRPAVSATAVGTRQLIIATFRASFTTRHETIA
jgi:hypothetical protein